MLMTYSEICKRAKAAGMVPLETPSKEQCRRLKDLAVAAAKAYSPLPGDVDLLGWYAFVPSDQRGEQRDCDGVCSINDDGEAVIGLSVELLSADASWEYGMIVTLHEIAHLSYGEHAEGFSRRLLGLQRAFFMQSGAEGARQRMLTRFDR